MTYVEIKAAISAALNDLFPGIPVYGNDTVEGYNRPCFFLDVIPETDISGVNFQHKYCTVEITKVQRTADEADALDFFNAIERAFYLKLAVGDRKINTSRFAPAWIGDFGNVPTITFELEWFEAVEKRITQPLIEEVITEESVNGITAD